MNHFIKTLLFLLALPLMALSQNHKPAFKAAYMACPDIPKGLLEGISFTNTHCHHLTDANYSHDGPEAMPRAYGLMGLVKVSRQPHYDGCRERASACRGVAYRGAAVGR